MLAVSRRVKSQHIKRAPKHRRSVAQKAISTASGTEATVLVVDDDRSVLPALARLIRAAGFKVRIFDRPSALLASELPKTNACMLIDVHLTT